MRDSLGIWILASDVHFAGELDLHNSFLAQLTQALSN